MLTFSQRSAIAGQLHAWQVLPRPERLTELYFTNPTELPKTLKKGIGTEVINFTIHNLEFQSTTYKYDIVVTTTDGSAPQVLNSGNLRLGHGRSRVITQAVTIPPLGSRMAIQVTLHYESLTPGQDRPKPQTQAIKYWVKASG